MYYILPTSKRKYPSLLDRRSTINQSRQASQSYHTQLATLAIHQFIFRANNSKHCNECGNYCFNLRILSAVNCIIPLESKSKREGQPHGNVRDCLEVRTHLALFLSDFWADLDAISHTIPSRLLCLKYINFVLDQSTKTTDVFD